MVKVVYKSLARSKDGSAVRARRVRTKRVTSADGSVKRVSVLDVASKTFDADLQYLFEKNVERARKEYKRAIRSTPSAKRKP